MDDARFDRQRRNVMVTSSLLIATWLVKGNFSNLSFFGLTAGYPHRIEILWVFLIIYFLWRLFQMTGKEQQKDIIDLFQEIFVSTLTGIAKKQVIEERRLELEKEAGTGRELLSSIVLLVDGGATYQSKEYKFTADFYVSSHWKTPEGDSHESGKRKKSFVTGQPEFALGIRKTRVLVLLKRKTFTEYTLPYLLGFIAIAIGIFGF